MRFININHGNFLLFNQSLPHGNVVNKTNETRISINCRFKGLFTPYARKKLGSFFSPLTVMPASQLGLNYKFRRIILKFRGYISSRDLTDGSFVDQSIQNLIIRKSCEQRNFQYMLSATEYGMKNCFLMLNQVILELKKNKFDGVAFYSIDQLPNNTNLRKKIYEVVIKIKRKFLILRKYFIKY